MFTVIFPLKHSNINSCLLFASGDTYKEHVKCISEDQKYGGKDYKPKANANKGERKQEAWTEVIRTTFITTIYY